MSSETYETLPAPLDSYPVDYKKLYYILLIAAQDALVALDQRNEKDAGRRLRQGLRLADIAFSQAVPPDQRDFVELQLIDRALQIEQYVIENLPPD